jgi:hypothetical protein
MQITINIDDRDLKEIMRRLDRMPRNIQRGAASAALRAGAKVVADRSKLTGPACYAYGTKLVKRRRDEGAAAKYSVMVEGKRPGANIPSGIMGSNTKIRRFVSLSKCGPAFWTELGTYGNRDLAGYPYKPSTVSKYMRMYGAPVSMSPFRRFKNAWIPARPFLLPALEETAKDGTMFRAIAKKLDEYLAKKGG